MYTKGHMYMAWMRKLSRTRYAEAPKSICPTAPTPYTATPNAARHLMAVISCTEKEKKQRILVDFSKIHLASNDVNDLNKTLLTSNHDNKD